MKTLLIAALLSTSACFCYVVGVSDTGVYIRDSCGAAKSQTTKDNLDLKSLGDVHTLHVKGEIAIF